MIIRVLLFCSVAIVNVAFASSAQPPVQDPAFLMWVIGGLCTLLFTIACFIMAGVARNLTRLFERLDTHGERIRAVEVKTGINP